MPEKKRASSVRARQEQLHAAALKHVRAGVLVRRHVERRDPVKMFLRDAH
jgi:hypothetical protein